MSAVTKFFFRSPYLTQSSWSILQWWEARRLAYNVAVGGAGLLSLTTVALVAGLPPHPRVFHVAWDVVVIYGLLANASYSLGPAVDVLVHRQLGPRYGAIGPTLFRYGFVFAVGLSLMPIPLVLLGWIARTIGM